MRRIVVALTLIAGAVLAAAALATPSSGVTAETFRGTFAEELKVNTELANGARVKLKTDGAVELITQRIVAEPGATLGWHHHPGRTSTSSCKGP